MDISPLLAESIRRVIRLSLVLPRVLTASTDTQRRISIPDLFWLRIKQCRESVQLLEVLIQLACIILLRFVLL